MSVLYIALPIALVLAFIAVIAFVVQVRNGQFDDLETPPRRMLFDDVDTKPKNEKLKR
jgi:cbb3-type cytochrome oxidase maturation protein